ncbi:MULTISPECIES: EscU/YscU/HrcU family type III secretion system export apparatus switch protein [Helicobacter]|uniref:ABC transporter, putative n=1 Tax=Helicobacter typhlonius TaxID=76936 RepID=A0A099UDE7_9HELI|nr:MULTISPECIES: EscU/YscU/HrcU family type III secretion system export apparatus switch protein [Helicobacter]TLD78856.1 flagellar biosynthesis protein FlhB [Helicobacter typhlonius]TLD90189.1 flagellar biosynthesis protein FlhB [Helicobacter sp. MIT 03-1616]CUU40857.1 ABC transporter, putative [Helicobacter typhlonius]HCD72663.1 flagellar biosynthesis protein FlhB [Helicobacter sp.]
MKAQKAVALSYDKQTDSAPRVVAKGQNELALRIIAKAKAFDVPLFANPLLVDSLLQIPLDSHIPPEMYNAVVEVFVWLLKCEKQAQLSKDMA